MRPAMTNSAVASGVYTIDGACATPTFSPVAGTYSAAQSVTIGTATDGATIRYTTDGSTPSETAGTIYCSAGEHQWRQHHPAGDRL